MPFTKHDVFSVVFVAVPSTMAERTYFATANLDRAISSGDITANH